MKTIREEIFENKGILPATISGTYGTHYIDNREVHINKLYSTLHIAIQIKDAGYVNNKKPEPYSKEFLESLIADGVANHYSGKWYMNKYELDEW